MHRTTFETGTGTIIGRCSKMVHCHTAANAFAFLQKEKDDFIEPQMWPPNCPDLNPIDYATWGALQQKVYM